MNDRADDGTAVKRSADLTGASVSTLVLTALVPFLFVIPLVLGGIMIARDYVGRGVAVMAAAVLIFVIRLAMYADTGYESAF